jgi:chaperonin GroEL
MRNEVIFNPNLRILEGAKIIYDAVKTTAGAAGRNVLIKNGINPLIVTKDGWTVAMATELPDDVNALGAEAVISAATSANNENGDGSTATVILAYNLLKEGLSATQAKFLRKKINIFEFSKGIQDAYNAVELFIKSRAKTDFNVYDVANISTNNDSTLSSAIAKAINLVGKDGSIYIEPSNTKETYVKKQDGVSLPAGYISYAFSNNEKYTAKYRDPLVVVIDHELEDVREIRHYIQYAIDMQSALVIIANDYNNDVINMLVANRIQKKLPIVAIKSPFYGEKRSLFLEDLANMIGAKLIGERQSNYKDLGLKGQNAERVKSAGKNVGRVKSIIVSEDETIINYTSLNEEYIDKLKSELNSGLNYIQERYNIFTAMVANIFIGATTEIELKERMYRGEDAINAVRSALKGGVVKGGGMALLQASLIEVPKNITHSEKIGWDCLLEAITKPSMVILENFKSGYFTHAYEHITSDNGVDVRSGEVVDFFKEGIIDPADVVLGALKHAVSVVKTLLTTEVAVFNTKR